MNGRATPHIQKGGDAPTPIRRRDRERHDSWIRAFLRLAPHGVLAMRDEDGPTLNSNLFVYDEDPHCLLFHTARTGRTPSLVARGGRATFTAVVMGRFLPAAQALEFSVEYGAVVASGALHEVTEPDEKRRGLEQIMAKYAPHLRAGSDYRAITEKEVGRTGVHRMRIDWWTGKEHTEVADFPGAYELPPVPLPLNGPDG